MTFYLKDTREGIELYQIAVAGCVIKLTCPTKIRAYELVRLSQTEGVYLSYAEEGE